MDGASLWLAPQTTLRWVKGGSAPFEIPRGCSANEAPHLTPESRSATTPMAHSPGIAAHGPWPMHGGSRPMAHSPRVAEHGPFSGDLEGAEPLRPPEGYAWREPQRCAVM